MAEPRTKAKASPPAPAAPAARAARAARPAPAAPPAVAAPPAPPALAAPASGASGKKVIYDADHAVLGRAASHIAKQLLLDPALEVIVVNADQAVITGSRVFTLAKFRARRARGQSRKGPFYPRRADRIFKRAVRGMLPYQQERGRLALKRLRCYHGVPKRYIGKAAKIEGANRLQSAKFLTLQQISESIG
jgi:large subunit ribosomal protein L13